MPVAPHEHHSRQGTQKSTVTRMYQTRPPLNQSHLLQKRGASVWVEILCRNPNAKMGTNTCQKKKKLLSQQINLDAASMQC